MTLSLTEANGLTQLSATVIRILTPDGTLLVETNDPAVKVTVEGDGGLKIDGAGLEEIHLRPGSYRVSADKDGQRVPLDRDLVNVTRGGRVIVKVKLEPREVASAANVEKGAFVLFTGAKEWPLDTLAEAVLDAGDGDTIEVRGNGPFVTDPVKITDQRALTIRAASGFRPVLRLAPGEVDDHPYLLITDAPLVLEGLEFRCVRRPTAKTAIGYSVVNADAEQLHVANCRFVAPYRHSLWTTSSRRAVARNCEFLGSLPWTDGLAGRHVPGAVWELENCVQIGGGAVSCAHTTEDVQELTVRIHRCSLINCVPTYFTFRTTPKDPESGLAVRLMRVDLSESLTDTNQLLGARWHKDAALSSLVGWSGADNVHNRVGIGPPERQIAPIDAQGGLADGVKGVNDLEAWRKFWDSPETGSIEGEIRYQGGDLAGRLTTAPEQITPEDFRLREGSAGYRAGKDGKDLGADVDLLGPGAAYERWKKTPEYQQWLKDTKNLTKAEAPKPEPQAFVVLGGAGVAERKSDTLAEAVISASDGDTIEVRGNGPFVTDPLDLGTKALTIRAGEGYTPVIKPSAAAVKAAGDLASASLLSAQGSLTLEGLDLRYEQRPEEVDRCLVYSSSAPLNITNCKLLVLPGKDPQPRAVNAWESSVQIRNCLIVSPTYGVLLGSSARKQGIVENCLIAANTALSAQTDEENSPGSKFRLTRNTWAAGIGLTLQLPTSLADRLLQATPKPVPATPVETEGNVWQVRNVFGLNSASAKHPQGLPAKEQRRIIPKLLRWRDQGDVYGLEQEAFVTALPTGFIKDLAEWNQYWGLKDTGSSQGPVLLCCNPQGLLESNPVAITPDDFRLREGSAGYRAGKDGKDLGADVDLVGPGEAYERWKQTPEYQEWLRDTGQMK